MSDLKEKKILIVASFNFFSTYGGGQVYVKNLVDEMIVQGLNITVISFVGAADLNKYTEQDYKGVKVFGISSKARDKLKELIILLQPALIHAHSEKGMLAELGVELSIPCVITAHHGGITCPAGTLLNYKDEICHIKANQNDCFPCVLKNIRGGIYFYPLLKKIPIPAWNKVAALVRKLPFIYFVTSISISRWLIERKQNEWQSIINNVTLVIAPSDAIADNMVINGLDQRKIQIIPHGIPLSEDRQKIPVDSSGRAIRFFYVGRICHVKGIHILLEAFSSLHPAQSELHLIGDLNGRYQQRLLNKYKGHSNIIFHGKIEPDQVAESIRQFDVLVHPAIYLEVFGLNMSESLWEGKPVIATRCGGAEMQIEDGENGILVTPNSVTALQNAMQSMIDNPEEVSKMSRKASKKVINITDHVKNLCEFYSKLLHLSFL